MAIQTLKISHDCPIDDCNGGELLKGDTVKLVFRQEVICGLERVIGQVKSVNFCTPFGRDYYFEYDDVQLEGRFKLTECMVDAQAYCCCDRITDAIGNTEALCEYFGGAEDDGGLCDYFND